MKNLNRFKILNESLVAVAESLNPLREVQTEREVLPQVRLVPAPYHISETKVRNSCAVTVHNLQEYKVRAYTLQLHEDCKSWLTALLEIDEGSVGAWN